MKLAYVDTSVLAALVFGEHGVAALARRVERFDRVVSSNVLEAELRATLARERVAPPTDFLSWMMWVLPERALSGELQRVLTAGLVRGADAWHLACALYVAGEPQEVTFLTLDARQQAVAQRLGFRK